ncbi:MAG: hypothetical protein E7425_09650 [Ruminococcaceae bacterium]|nr:hypothetical protein [Oscillospiraceae bacterium]
MKKTAKKAALTTAIALLTAASVVTGSLFESPAALLPDDGAPSVVYNVTTGLDGADDDDAGMQDDESEETRRRGGVRAALRQRILQLPLIVRLLVVLPLWALGSVLLAAGGAAWTLAQPVLGKIAGFALMLALLAGCFLIGAKAAFPDLPVKKLLNRRSLVALLLGASGLSVLDAVLVAVWGEYEAAKAIVLSAGFFVALCSASIPFALHEQKRRLASAREAAERQKKPEKLTFTDAAGTFTVTIPNPGA